MVTDEETTALFHRLVPKSVDADGVPPKEIWLPIDTKIKGLLARKRAPKIDFKDGRHFVPDIRAGDVGPYHYARRFLYFIAQDLAGSSEEIERLRLGRLDNFKDELGSARSALAKVAGGLKNDLSEGKHSSVAIDLFRGFGVLPDYGPDKLSKAFKTVRKRLDRDLDTLFAACDALQRLERRSARQSSRLSSRKSTKGRAPTYWKTRFVRGVSRLWQNITLSPPSNGPQSLFADFVSACWESIDEKVPDVSFDSAIRRLNIRSARAGLRAHGIDVSE